MVRFLSKKQVRELTTLSLSTIDRLEQKGEFPHRRAVRGSERVVWIEEEIQEWMAAIGQTAGQRTR